MFRDGELEPNEPAFPIVVVTSEKCRAAFFSLVTPARSKKEPEWHFDDLDAAIQYAVKMVEEWFDF